MMPTTHIVIVTYQRPRLLQSLLESLNSTLHSNTRVVIIINGHDSESELLLKSYPNFSTIAVKTKLTPAAARNLALKDLQSEWVLFLDDDVIIPADYFSTAKNFLRAHPTAIAFGGSDAPYPDCSNWELSLNITLGSILATAHTRHRHKNSSKWANLQVDEGSLTLCNLWIRSDVFHTHNLKFNELYLRNEENVLLAHIEEISNQIYRAPNLIVFHKRRDQFLSAMKSVAVSGFYRMKSVLEDGKLSNPLYLAPILGLIFFTVSLFLSNALVWKLLLSGYLLSVLGVSIWEGLKAKRPDLIPMVFINHLGINLAYALGSLKGLFIS